MVGGGGGVWCGGGGGGGGGVVVVGRGGVVVVGVGCGGGGGVWCGGMVVVWWYGGGGGGMVLMVVLEVVVVEVWWWWCGGGGCVVVLEVVYVWCWWCGDGGGVVVMVVVETEGGKKLLLSSLIQPSPERIIWCYGQWQSLYDNIRKRIPRIEFVNGIPDYLNDQHYIDVSKRNVLVFDDLMTEAKCDQRIADLFTKGSHHRNISVVYLTQNLFPQGKACRDIILNTQYMVLFNNPIDRQQVATLARRIYPSTSAVFMKRFERATSYPYGHLVIDLKSDTAEKDRLHTEIFDTAKRMDEKMAEDRGSVGTQYEEEEEEERGGGLRKRRRIEEEEEEEEDEEQEEEMEEGNMSVIRSDLPPGRQEHQELMEHTVCLAHHTNSNDCF